MKTLKIALALCLTFAVLSATAQNRALIPVPNQVTWGNSQFTLPKNATISCDNAALRPAAEYLSGLLSAPTGYKMPVVKGKGTIRLMLTEQGKAGGYKLSVTDKGVTIEGNTYRGVINGIATLRQLFDDKVESKSPVEVGKWTLPLVEITDAPRFEWRGMELDCSRHFFTKDEVKELLDVLALYKINKFHWHLTDDQGWRIEIKKYPLLTRNGAWRTYNNQDTVCINRAIAEDNPELQIDPTKMRTNEQGERVYGGFYTQEDIKDIVAYAQVRGIDIIPEIDMPGHSLAAISNYEGLSCYPQIGWGAVFSTPLCPGKDKTLEFCKDVWREVLALFPYKYVHIGGDEVEKKNWKTCPDCQKHMADHQLKTEEQLQSWFIHYMEDFFNANGRDMIGWDEIIEGGLSPTSTVMWWRSWEPKAMKEATSHGNPVICTPNTQFYLDYDESNSSIPNIYRFNAQPDDLTDAEKALVLGVQGNLWTEWVPTRERMFNMGFPRMLAVAELGWSNDQTKNLEDFNKRLISHYNRLHTLGVTYRIPDLTGFYNTNVFTEQGKVQIDCQDPSAVIRYTTDGSMPQTTSTRYNGPFTVDETTHFTFRTFSPDGRKGDVAKCSFVHEDLAPAVNAPVKANTLQAVWHDFAGVQCADIETAKVLGTFDIDDVEIPAEAKGNIGLVITGYINVPVDGVYTFALLSDDGSWLKVDGKMVVDNDKEHSPRELIGQHAMVAGLHPIEVRYFDHNGGQLKLRVLDANGNAVKVNYCR